MLNEEECQTFVEHIIGITALSSWVSQWTLIKGYKQDEKNRTVFDFDSVMSQRFMLGTPLNQIKYGKHPFLAFQSLEYKWASMIRWHRACVNLEEKKLYLVSKKIKTIDNSFVEPLIISILFSDEKILEILKNKGSLSLKHFWYEDEMDKETDLNNYKNFTLSYKNRDIVLPLFFIEDVNQIINKTQDAFTHVDSNILFELRQRIYDNSKPEVAFIQGKGKIELTAEETEFLKKTIAPLDYSKPKIRIRVD